MYSRKLSGTECGRTHQETQTEEPAYHTQDAVAVEVGAKGTWQAVESTD